MRNGTKVQQTLALFIGTKGTEHGAWYQYIAYSLGYLFELCSDLFEGCNWYAFNRNYSIDAWQLWMRYYF